MVVSTPIAGIEGIGGEEVRQMLSAIPPRPDYDTWLRIASAVWSVLGMAEGARLLHQWSPEVVEGEYAAKYQSRLKRIGVGTLVYIAKQHGFDLRAWRAERAAKTRQASLPLPARPVVPFAPKGERLTNFSNQSPAPMPTAPTVDTVEANRIAGELGKLYDMQVIEAPNDQNARFFAKAIHMFRASVSPSTLQPNEPEIIRPLPANK
jgi:hypothetical protein